MEPSIPDLVQLATDAVSQGRLVLADLVCRDILDSEPVNADALNILGIIAARLGRREQAGEYFGAALRSDPSFAQAANNAQRLQAMPVRQGTQHTVEEQRYLLIKAWGFGFWADVTQVMGALLLADLTGRIPVTHWGKNSLFSDGGERDSFTDFFEPVSPYTVDSLADGADFFPPKWTRHNLRQDDNAKWNGPFSRLGGLDYLIRPEAVAVVDFYVGVIDLMPWIPKSHRLFGKTLEELYRDLAERYLRPRAKIIAAVENFYCDHLDERTVAVHYRGSDKKREMPELDATNARYFDLLDKIDPAFRIFLLTDDARAAARFTARYGDRVILSDCQRTNSDSGVHYLSTSDRTQLGIEVMIDAYLAMRCPFFIGNGKSNVSAVVATLKAWPDGACTLITPSFLQERNVFIHLTPGS